MERLERGPLFRVATAAALVAAGVVGGVVGERVLRPDTSQLPRSTVTTAEPRLSPRPCAGTSAPTELRVSGKGLISPLYIPSDQEWCGKPVMPRQVIYIPRGGEIVVFDGPLDSQNPWISDRLLQAYNSPGSTNWITVFSHLQNFGGTNVISVTSRWGGSVDVFKAPLAAEERIVKINADVVAAGHNMVIDQVDGNRNQ